MADKVIFAMYDDDDKLMDGAKHLVANKVKVSDVYSPMPLHGIDPIIGVEHTRLAITAFMYGLTGTMLAIIWNIFGCFLETLPWPKIIQRGDVVVLAQIYFASRIGSAVLC